MNGQLIQVRLPLEVIREIVAQLSPQEKERLIFGEKKVNKKKISLYGCLKGLRVDEKDFREAEKSLFPSIK